MAVSKLDGSKLPKGMGRYVVFNFTTENSEYIFETANVQFVLAYNKTVLLNYSLNQMTVLDKSESTLVVKFYLPGSVTLGLNVPVKGLELKWETYFIPFNLDPIIYQGIITVVPSLFTTVDVTPPGDLDVLQTGNQSLQTGFV